MMEGHDQPCYYCGMPCSNLAGNPSLWPIALCHDDDPGRVKWHHTGCVQVRLYKLQKMEELFSEIDESFKTHTLDYIKAITGITNEQRTNESSGNTKG